MDGPTSENEHKNGASLLDDELRLIDAWWRAANYLAVGQIYLMDNPLTAGPHPSRTRTSKARTPTCTPT
jgi:phosphoketolase